MKRSIKILITIITGIGYLIMVGLLIAMSNTSTQLIAMSVPAVMLFALFSFCTLLVWTN